jgi:hypothetical protein
MILDILIMIVDKIKKCFGYRDAYDDWKLFMEKLEKDGMENNKMEVYRNFFDVSSGLFQRLECIVLVIHMSEARLDNVKWIESHRSEWTDTFKSVFPKVLWIKFEYQIPLEEHKYYSTKKKE